MDFKNAAAICLISFFAASLVVLIARSLDLQAASHLEPQVKELTEEIRLLRKQIGSGGASIGGGSQREELAVMFFHGETRCVTCETIERLAREVVDTRFADEKAIELLVWEDRNYETTDRQFALDHGVYLSTVVLVERRGDEILGWRRLDQAFPLAAEPELFREYVGDAIADALRGEGLEHPANDDDQPEAVAPDEATEDETVDEVAPPLPDGLPVPVPLPTP